MALDIAKELSNRKTRLKAMDRYFSAPMEYDETKMKFNIKCIDVVAGGIKKNDFIIVSAPSGHGKTEIGSLFALKNALEGKRVAYFALEAYEGEIEHRMKWQLIKKKLCNHNKIYRFDEWLEGDYKQDKIFMGAMEEVVLEHKKIFSENLFSSYVDERYTIKELHQDVTAAKINYNCDVIVLDHLHFFDMTTQNENQEMKAIMKKISSYCKCYAIPILAIAHIRKNLSKLCPTMDEIYGSSDISKIVTKVITFAHAKDVEKQSSELVPTYFKVCKARKRGGTDYYTILCDFNLEKYRYEDDFNIYYTNFDDTKLIDIDSSKWPYWYKHEYTRKVKK
jgi:replicative DNA helicase